jgi:hypothetical protein
MTSLSAARATRAAKPTAVVVGAGIAGLSAAFYLAERGFQVTVYEKEHTAGGNLGATIARVGQKKPTGLGEVFEVYPHMFGDWYQNFWCLMEAIGRGKNNREIWRAMGEFKFLPQPKTWEGIHHPSYRSLRNNGSLESLWSNLFSGIIPLPDMILAGYAALGLLAEDFKDTDDLNVATLNDFLNTRFYGSKYVTQFYQMIILYIWSMEADRSSVYACQRFFQYQFRRPSPSAWVLNSGDAYTSIIQPLVSHLQSKWKVRFHFDAPVVAAALNQEQNSVEQLLVIENYSQTPRYKRIPKQPTKTSAAVYVLAVPPETLAALVQTPIPVGIGRRGSGAEPGIRLGSNRFGILTDILLDPPSHAPRPDAITTEGLLRETDGETSAGSASSADPLSTGGTPPSPAQRLSVSSAIVEAIPEVATAKTLSAEPIPVLYVAFKKGAEINRLIPDHCYVGLTDSRYALTLVEVTEEFKTANPHISASAHPVETIVALAASDYGELPIFKVPPVHLDRQRHHATAMADETPNLEDKSRDLLLQEAQKYLPFTDTDIQWSFFRSNTNHRLFLNDVESARNPVQPVYRPRPKAAPTIKNIAFAGDFCSQDVVMSTVEGAVESGIRAGMELAHNHLPSTKDGRLTLQSHSAYPKPLVASLKLMLLPSMVLVKSWSDLHECVEEIRPSISESSPIKPDALPLLLNYWPRQAAMCLGASQDALHTLSSLATESFLTSSQIFWSVFNRR